MMRGWSMRGSPPTLSLNETCSSRRELPRTSDAFELHHSSDDTVTGRL